MIKVVSVTLSNNGGCCIIDFYGVWSKSQICPQLCLKKNGRCSKNSSAFNRDCVCCLLKVGEQSFSTWEGSQCGGVVTPKLTAVNAWVCLQYEGQTGTAWQTEKNEEHSTTYFPIGTRRMRFSAWRVKPDDGFWIWGTSFLECLYQVYGEPFKLAILVLAAHCFQIMQNHEVTQERGLIQTVTDSVVQTVVTLW